MKKRWFLLLSICLVLIVLVSCTQPAPAPTAAPQPTAVITAQPTQPPAPAPGRTAAPAPVVTPRPTSPAPAATPQKPYYEGKTIELMVGSAAGGGTDTMARFTAAYMPKYIPGKPKMIVRNYASAQGVVAANTFMEKIKPDGFTLLQDSSGTISLQIMREPIVKYDLRKFRAVGHVARAESVLMIKKGLKGRLTDRNAEPIVNATRAGSETWQSLPLWGNEFLGWNVRWLPGFAGNPEMELALRRGEIHMFGTANAYVLNRLKDEGEVELLVQIGSIKGGKFTRRPDFPDVPTLEELLGDKKPTGIPWQAYLAWVGPGLVDKNLAAPPGTPDNIMKILIDAFEKMTRDPTFVANVKKTVSEVYDVGIGKETEEMMANILDAPLEAIEYSKSLQKKYKIISD
ncbi:MAG: tripartite tricarboxylate transporter substrate-binding protein [Dehalococcoidia bacterium]|nr:tripartite tricarboxylate transporter substrate-binding protein [Dehalococcoidia bacterium]MDZ4245574.1 tripartite tricarboxylate transporter substrate-binding protein [Dehalococcoidia bacterium]